MDGVIDALMTLVVGGVAVLTIGTNSNTSIQGHRFVVVVAGSGGAVVAIAGVKLAGNAA